jgi:16S rRNA (guanine966-N2)-methyltransferase
MLRIIAGEFGGRRIRAPAGRWTRPTRDAVREAWFSALGDDVIGAVAVDLYAGSGALGIEALSRGAASMCFVEKDRRAASVLAANLSSLGVEARCTVVRGDVAGFLSARGAKGDPPFDLALADPPYDTDDAAQLVQRFRAEPFAATLCVEHAPRALEGLEAAWNRRYGDTELSFFVPDGGRTAG